MARFAVRRLLGLVAVLFFVSVLLFVVFTVLPAKGAELHVVIETRDREHLGRVVQRLEEAGFLVVVKGVDVGRTPPPRF